MSAGTTLRLEQFYCQYDEFYDRYTFDWVFIALDGDAAGRLYADKTLPEPGMSGSDAALAAAYPAFLAPVDPSSVPGWDRAVPAAPWPVDDGETTEQP